MLALKASQKKLLILKCQYWAFFASWHAVAKIMTAAVTENYFSCFFFFKGLSIVYARK
jgi:dimeric dUTPase (all-alpha-NTP-PPase superfamily)